MRRRRFLYPLVALAIAAGLLLYDRVYGRREGPADRGATTGGETHRVVPRGGSGATTIGPAPTRDAPRDPPPGDGGR